MRCFSLKFATNLLATSVRGPSCRYLAVDATVKEKFDKIVKDNSVVVFMKGVPEAPQCGFSNAVVQVCTPIDKLAYELNYNVAQLLSDPSNAWRSV